MASIMTVFSYFTHSRLKLRGLHLAVLLRLTNILYSTSSEVKKFQKECFRRVFVCFKACQKGFLEGCRPYLVVDATTLNGRFRGQLVVVCAIDAHNWLFL